MARIAAGDARALGTLYDTYGAVVYGLALAITQDRPAAESVVADAFAAVWREAPRLVSNRQPVFPWLSSTVRGLALTRRPAAPAAGPASTPPPADSPVAAALARLDGTQRRALELAYFHGLSRREIAAVLGQPEGDVGRNLRQAMEVLRNVFPAGRYHEGPAAAPRLAAGT